MINLQSTITHLFLTINFILICQLSVLGQEEYRFTNYDFRHGLPTTYIKAIAQDSLGFMWFGSANGVVRFDGYQFHYFVEDTEDGAIMAGIDVSTIEVDHSGRIWVATHGNGIRMYDYKQKTFTSLRNLPDSIQAFQSNVIHDFHFDSKGNIYMGGRSRGILKRNNNGSWEIIRFPQATHERIWSFLSDPSNPDHFYFGDTHLYHFDNQNKIPVKVETGQTGWRNLQMDKNGRIWGTAYSENINVYDPIAGDSDKITIEEKVLSDTHMDTDYCWMATITGGIYKIDLNTFVQTSIEPRSFDPWSIPTNVSMSVFKGKGGLIWIGTAEGVSLLDPLDQQISSIKLKGDDQVNYIETHYVIPFKEKHLAVAYYEKSVYIIDPQTGDYQTIPRGKDAAHFHAPFEVFQSDNKYYALYSNGLGVIDEHNYSIDNFNSTCPGDIFGKQLILDMDLGNGQDIWAVDYGKYIFHINLVDGQMDTFHLIGKPDFFNPTCIQFHNDKVWVTGAKGIACLNPANRKIEYFDSESYSQFEQSPLDIIVDNEDMLWVSTRKGELLKFEYSTDTLILVKQYDMSNGLAGKNIGEMTITESGHLYVVSESGFSRYDQKADRFYSWAANDGLLTNRLNGISSFQNQVFLTLNHGYSYFKNNELEKSTTPPVTQIINLTVGSRNFTNELHIEKNDFTFGNQEDDMLIEYVGLHLSDPMDVKYQIRLQNDDPWVEVGSSERSVRYSNLNSGEYTFSVRSSTDGVIWGDSTNITFRIKAPIWQRTWFVLLSIALLGFGLYSFFKWRENQIKTKEETKAKMAELELKALRSQMNPHFMFNSLNSIKNYILKSKPTEAAQYLSSFSHLIRMTLQNSRKRTVSLRQELDTLMLYIDLEKLRFKKGFEFTCEVDEQIDLEEMQIPPLLLQPYVENAIWHGLMHKKEDAILSLHFRKMNGNIECIIEDNGVGRQKAEELKSSSARKYKSMGMGITKDRIDILNQMSAMGIHVTIVDKSNNDGTPSGTQVILKLPLENQKEINE